MTAHFRPIRSLALLLLFASPTAAFAQDSAKVGVVVNTSGGFSVIWRASERVALRPELGLSSAKVENSALQAESTSSLLSPSISVLFYTGPRADVRVYVSPRYTYSRNHSESRSPLNTSEQTVGTHSFSGAVGAEYSPHKRFGIYGEVGPTFSRARISTTTNRSWTIRSVAGVILNF